MTDNVRVAVRCRPLSSKEISDGYQSIVEFPKKNIIVVNGTTDQNTERTGDRRSFTRTYEFDAVFDCNATQEQVYNAVCRPIVDGILKGYNGTIFAYGQTGTGKTYTMEGASLRLTSAIKRPISTSSKANLSTTNSSRRLKSNEISAYDREEDESHLGIIQRASKHIFEHIASQQGVQFLVRVSYLEIYQEEIHDLLRKEKSNKLELHERSDVGVYVKGLTSFVCKSIVEIERVMKVGNQNRRVGATDMNEHSSRSHAIFMITVEQQSKLNDAELLKGDQSGCIIRVGKLNLIDLAGSERQRKTNTLGQRQKESVKINLSLTALGNVINALMKKSQAQQQNNRSSNSVSLHTPYRDSKLTRLLQDSLGGNAKTLMIANIGPAGYNYDETINTLNYASRAKFIRNRPRLNEDPKDALLRELQREINELRQKLKEVDAGTSKSRKSSSIVSLRQDRARSRGSKDHEAQSDKQESSKEQIIGQELINLRQKLSSLEGKLLNRDKEVQVESNRLDHGDVLQGYTKKQEIELEARKSELASQINKERAIRDELERREEMELMTKQSFSSVQQELDAKRKLIRQVLVKIKAMRDSIESSQDAYRIEVDELDQLQYVLTKELRLKCLIMDNFIPNQHVNQLLSRILYDEKTNRCIIRPIDLPLDSCKIANSEDPESSMSYEEFWETVNKSEDHHGSTFRPKSEFERIEETIFPSNIRFKYENFIEQKVLLPDISTSARRLNPQFDSNSDIESSNSERDRESNKVQKLVEEALNKCDSDIVI